MKNKPFLYTALLSTLLLALLITCKKESIKVVPTVTISTVSNITSNLASSGGNVTSDGGSTVTAKGVCWGTNQNPTTSDSKTNNGPGSGSFTSSMTGLNPGTTYTFRAYAINAIGTAYSSQSTFTTLALAPVLTTTVLTAITSTTATSGGNINTDGGSAVTARGVCWATTQNPTTAGSKTTDGTGPGTFTSNLTGLLPGTTYYVKAYATNSIGTTYGNQETITTVGVAPVLTTATPAAITSTTATSGGNISSDGGSAVTARGVCWATTQNPTTAGSKTTNGTGPGTFTSNLTGLLPGTTYYVKAYATNSIGTTYGNQVTLTTTAVMAVLTTTATSAITSTTATSGGNISGDGGSAITVRGICWATTQTPTIANFKTTSGAGIGTFSGNLTGLSRTTTYYVRAYATNSIGTSYGGQETFTTLAEAPVVATAAISAITNTSATSGGTVTSDGGSTISAKGVCWATSTNPTISNSKTTDGTGPGTFTSNISGLISGRTYYMRAYATNGITTTYGSEVSFTPGTVTDIDGNVYHYIVIGTQTWMVENLKTTKYRNGDAISNITSSWTSLVTGAYSWYSNDAATYKAAYGALYNWYAVADTRGIAPAGWHVPTDAEWKTLTDYLGGSSVAGGKLKEAGTSHWITPNTGASNSSGFTALPGGNRYYIDGTFRNVGSNGNWWCITASDATNAWNRYLDFNHGNVERYNYGKQLGFSVRCVRD
jgi:uncharacterized protein (TIGR02145 family)